jgi:hypothetical protein
MKTGGLSTARTRADQAGILNAAISSSQGNQQTGLVEAQIPQGLLAKISNNLHNRVKLRIRLLKVGEGLLVVTNRYGEQRPPREDATCVLRGHPNDAAWRCMCFIAHAR